MPTPGILKGLAVTIRRFLETYIGDLKRFPHRYAPEGRYRRLRPGERGAFTVQYPEERLEMFPRFRGALMQLTDPQTGLPKCTACGICARSCPVGVIEVVRAPEKREGKFVPESYTWNLAPCIFCGLCVESCPFGALCHSPEFELSTYGRGDGQLIFDLARLLALGRKYAPDGVPPVEQEK
ncbi:MAG TPA: hypothetical protein DCP08_00195 [Chloroflexi bacterium]|nr:hypothetical protein [Chloroflexota bacterium]